MAIYYLIYVLILISYFICLQHNLFIKPFFIIFCIVLVLFAGLRGMDVSRDMYNYVLVFDNANAYTDNTLFSMEPMAKIIPVTLKYLHIYYYWSVFLCFAILSVPLKFRAILKYSPLPMVSVLLFFSYFYLLQDFTQIRAAVAAAILLWSIDDVINKKIINFILKIAIAVLFHFSAVAIFPLYFFSLKRLNKYKYATLLIICFIIGALRVNLLAFIPFVSQIGRNVDMYTALTNAADVATSGVVTVTNIIYLAICMLFILLIDTLQTKDQFSILFVKLLTYSLCIMFVLNPFSVAIAGRFFELIACSTIISFMYFIYLIKPKYIGVSISILLSLYFFSLYVFRLPIVSSYFFNF